MSKKNKSSESLGKKVFTQKRRFTTIFIVIDILFIILVSFLIIKRCMSYRKAQQNYNIVKEQVVTDNANALERTVDFSYLEEKNHLISSWIYIPDTVIDYPVVQGINNELYLDYDAYGNESASGAIFLNCTNNPDLSDKKTIIYGHSMRDGSMFHALHDYEDETFAKDHNTLYFYLPSGEIREYQLLCTLTAKSTDRNLYLYDESEDSAAVYDYILSKAEHVYTDNLDNDTNIIILSTCIRGDNRRVVVFQEM